jgi:hypothetical protein
MKFMSSGLSIGTVVSSTAVSFERNTHPAHSEELADAQAECLLDHQGLPIEVAGALCSNFELNAFASNLVEAIMARPVMRPRSKPDPIDIGGETNIRPLSE